MITDITNSQHTSPWCIPDGDYPGVWGGKHVAFDAGNRRFVGRLKSRKKVNTECVVVIRAGTWRVEV